MKLGTLVTIHSQDNTWDEAEIVGFRKDTIQGIDDVYIVRHPHFEEDLDFSMEPDTQGRHLNVGNADFWIDKPWIEASR